MARLVPKPHIIASMRARNWTLPEAIEELVDNSIGHGRATEVTVTIDNAKGIGVGDNGIGIDDINRIFCLGDASATANLAEIGQFGAGSKDAAVWLGDLVRVDTIRDGRFHTMTVDWGEVERSGWPEEYHGGRGQAAAPGESGTRILVNDLNRRYQLETSVKMATDFGQIFAPAVRKGVRIRIEHFLADERSRELVVEPFTPTDLTKVKTISGEVETKAGPLRWTGRAGLSASLKDKFNAVHVAFGHRVIEVTHDPFRGRSVPTVYVEVQLDETTPWKHQLSTHKDKVVRHRAALMTSIGEAIADLLKEAEEEAQSLALDQMTAPIEAELNKAMLGLGLLHVEKAQRPKDDHPEPPPPEPPPLPPDTPPEPPPPPGPPPAHPIAADGRPAAPAACPNPTGIKIQFRDTAKMEGGAFKWDISGKTMLLKLDRELFTQVMGLPANLRTSTVKYLVFLAAAHAIDAEYHRGQASDLRPMLAKGVFQQLEDWASDGIAARLFRAFVAPKAA